MEPNDEMNSKIIAVQNENKICIAEIRRLSESINKLSNEIAQMKKTNQVIGLVMQLGGNVVPQTPQFSSAPNQDGPTGTPPHGRSVPPARKTENTPKV